MSEQTFWNGEPCKAEKVRAVVANWGNFPRYWAEEEGIVGQEIDLVRVDYFEDGPFWIDDRDGNAWRKVTEGRGSSAIGHRDVDIDRDTEVPR